MTMVVWLTKITAGSVDEVLRVGAGDTPIFDTPGQKGRNFCALTVHDGYLYIMGGIRIGGYSYNNHRMNEKTLAFEALADCPAGFGPEVQGAFVVGDNIYVFALSYWPEELIPYEYDTVNNVWTEKTHQPILLTPDGHFSKAWRGCLYNGKIYFGSFAVNSELYSYDPSADVWTSLTPDPYRGVCCAYEGKLISTPRNWYDDTWEKAYQNIRMYDPTTDTWDDFPVSFPLAKEGIVPWCGGTDLFVIDDDLYCIQTYSMHTNTRRQHWIDTYLWRYRPDMEDWEEIMFHPHIKRWLSGYYVPIAIGDKYLYACAGIRFRWMTRLFGKIIRIPLDYIRGK